MAKIRKINGGKVQQNKHDMIVKQFFNPPERPETEEELRKKHKDNLKKKRRAKRKATGR